MKVLIVEDDKKISEALCKILNDEEYLVDAVYDGMEGLYYANNNEYDAIILDVMLPKMDGYDVIKTLRKQKIKTPTLILTAKNEIDDRVKGLDFGADDYLPKPFDPKELLARLRAITRRSGDVIIDELSFSDITLDINSYMMTRGSKKISLSKKEFDILSLLIKNSGNIISKDQFIMKVWGDDSNASYNNVEAYISFLRKKLFYIGSSISIKSVRMLGYRLEAGND